MNTRQHTTWRLHGMNLCILSRAQAVPPGVAVVPLAILSKGPGNARGQRKVPMLVPLFYAILMTASGRGEVWYGNWSRDHEVRGSVRVKDAIRPQSTAAKGPEQTSAVQYGFPSRCHCRRQGAEMCWVALPLSHLILALVSHTADRLSVPV